MARVKLTADLIEAFAGTFLSPRYDDARPTPQFHREVWELYASDHKQAGAIAPRDHAKSTGFTFDYILAEACFRSSDYIILIGSTEDKAAEQLSNISEELHENQDLRSAFGIVSFESDQKTEIIVVHDDSHRFRIIARGAEQKIRGAMWNGKRPNLIVCDDMEDDEQVENKDRRAKFRRWFFRAAKQALSKRGRIRVHGTVLHDDALLPRLRKNRMWKFLFYKAHRSYNDFSDLLWPERWTAEDLRARQIEFEEDGDAPGYSQEFLNTPLDSNEAYLKKENFIPMDEDDYARPKRRVVGADFAVTKKDSANRTSFTVGGLDTRSIGHIEDQFVGRWKTDEWIEIIFRVDKKWKPEFWVVEDGQIWKSVEPFIQNEMHKRGYYINFIAVPSIKDKATRGRTLQKRHNNQAMRFDTSAVWYHGYENELLMFTGVTDALLDDQFDSTVQVSVGFDMMGDVAEEDDFMTEEEEEYFRKSDELRGNDDGRTCVGY
jgi:predicted phage terminase large subunit-like protein